MVLFAIGKIPTKESINMTVLIGNNGTGKTLGSIRDQMSRLKEPMAISEELIQGEQRENVERVEKMVLLREHLKTDDSIELRKRYSAYMSADMDLRKIHGITLRKYATMFIKYNRLQDEFIALATLKKEYMALATSTIME